MKEKATEIFGTCLGLILVPVLIGWGMSLSEKHDEKYPWKASIFTAANKSNIIDSKDVKTIEECRIWANEKAGKLRYDEGEWDYSCGRGCKFQDDKISGGKETHIYSCAEISK